MATTIDEIAAKAGVSKPTVFSAVGSKQDLLKTVRETAFTGDDEPVPVRKRPHIKQIQEEPDGARTVELMVKHLPTSPTGMPSCTRCCAPQRTLARTISGASGRQTNRRAWAAPASGSGFLQGKGLLRPDLTDREVVDILWLTTTPDNFYRLVHRRGWSRRMYERWLADAIARLLLE